MHLPKRIEIKHDDQLAMHIGRTQDGAQFFLTTPFIPHTSDNPGSQFIALYLFDPNGEFMGAKIDDLGPRQLIDTEKADARYEEFLNHLNQPTFCDIEVEAFQIEKHGIRFGIISHQNQLCLQPGNYKIFSHPWDGSYSM